MTVADHRSCPNVISPGHFHEGDGSAWLHSSRPVWNPLLIEDVGCRGVHEKDNFLLDSRVPLPFHFPGDHQMAISVANIQPIVALIAGVLILIMPRLLNFIVAIYLILVGIIGLGIIK
jgi:hypothetical protein